MIEKFGLAEFVSLESELHKVKKADIRAIRVVLQVMQIPNSLLEEAKSGIATGHKVVATLKSRISALGKEQSEAILTVKIEEAEVKKLGGRGLGKEVNLNCRTDNTNKYNPYHPQQ